MIDARTALMTTNDVVSLRPLVILAIRVMGPGRRRLEMVKLAHDMNDGRRAFLRPRGAVQLGARRRLIHLPRRDPKTWVLPMREAFLIQMDDFDRLLEYHLRRKLDAVVAAPVPLRRGRANRLKKARRAEPAAKTFGAIPIDLRPDALVFVEHS